MSCRVIGRNVEDRLLAEVLHVFRAKGAKRITAEYIATSKNAMTATFYDAHGFSLVNDGDDGRKRYERNVDG